MHSSCGGESEEKEREKRNLPERVGIDFDHLNIRIGTNDKLLATRIVAPQIAKGTCHRQKWYIIDQSAPLDGTTMQRIAWTIPDNTRYTRFDGHLTAGTLDTRLLCQRFGLVICRQLFGPPASLVGILIAQHDP